MCCCARFKLGKYRCKVHSQGLAPDFGRRNPLEIPACYRLPGVLKLSLTSYRSNGIYSWVNSFSQNGAVIVPDTIAANLLVRILRAAEAEGGDRRVMLAAVGLDDVNRKLARFEGQEHAAILRGFQGPL
jgi:hypothetical protein